MPYSDTFSPRWLVLFRRTQLPAPLAPPENTVAHDFEGVGPHQAGYRGGVGAPRKQPFLVAVQPRVSSWQAGGSDKSIFLVTKAYF